jgi:hypothetical protein
MTQAQQILNIISQFEDITSKEIIALLDNSLSINLSSRLIDLVRSGSITRKKIEKDGRNVWAYTATGNPPLKRGRKPNVTPVTKPIKTIADNVQTQTQLQIEFEKLREWKRRALIAHPELNVDPLVYKAREIFARYTDDKKLKDDIYSGKLDKRPPILALIEVLENGA